MSNVKILRQVKDLARNPYAWPGGYPRYAIAHDGECFCAKCVKAEYKRICNSMIPRNWPKDEWTMAGTDVNWEDPELFCVHCGDRIESAYAED